MSRHDIPAPDRSHAPGSPHAAAFLRDRLTGRRTTQLVDVELAVQEVDAPENADDVELATRIGGQPGWLQNDDSPGDDYDLIIQIDSTSKVIRS